MNYIELINKFWKCNEERPIGCNATALYFYLVKTCNSLGWKEQFKHSDRFISFQLDISVNTTRNAKNKLKQLGLIDFSSPKKPSRGLEGITIYSFKTISNFDTVADTVTDTVADTVTDTLNKLNKTKLKREGDKNPEPEISVFEKFKNNSNLDLWECFNEVISNQPYLETIAMNNKLGSVEKSIEWVNIFLKQLQNEGVEEKSISDFKSHFGRWLPIQIKRENGEKEKRNSIPNWRGHGQSGGKLIPVGGNSESSKDYTTV